MARSMAKGDIEISEIKPKNYLIELIIQNYTIMIKLIQCCISFTARNKIIYFQLLNDKASIS